MEIITERFLAETISPRAQHSHKGTYGRVLLIGGNKQYGGAIILASGGAVYSGAGLVTTCTAKENHAPLHAHLPEAMVISDDDTPLLQHTLALADVIVIGPGLGEDTRSKELLRIVFTQIKPHQYCIIDGSAISIIKTDWAHLPSERAHLIFTPHEMEWEKLSGLALIDQTPTNNQARQKDLGGIVVLKKHRTEVYTHQHIYQNPLGTPAMATGGMGDTLAGMIAGFLAQFQDKEKAILAAVRLHSQIGEEIGQTSYVALPSRIIQRIPSAMKEWEQR